MTDSVSQRSQLVGIGKGIASKCNFSCRRSVAEEAPAFGGSVPSTSARLSWFAILFSFALLAGASPSHYTAQ
jgi:hypothetical protein